MSENTAVSGWTNCYVGDLCLAMINGGTPSTTIAKFWEGTIPWVTGADFGPYGIAAIRRHISPEAVRRSATNVLKRGTILFVTRTGVGKIAIAQHDIAISQDITGLIPNEEKIDGQFLYYILYSEVDTLKKTNQGTSINGILRGDLYNYSVNIPILLSTQRKISRILTTLDDCIEQTETLTAKYQAMKEGLMHDLFTRGIGEDGKLRPRFEDAPELYKETVLGWVPRDWEVGTVRDAGTVKLGRQRSPKHQSGRFTTPYLRVANVYDGYIDYSDILSMDFTDDERSVYSVESGDIFLNEGQSLELVGRSALYDGEPGIYSFQNTLVRFRAFSAHNPGYCRWIFKYWLDTGRFIQIAKQTTSVAHLGAQRFARLPFFFPNKAEQDRITAKLDGLQRTIQTEEKSLKKWQVFKSGLLHDLLTGKTPVSADPTP